MATTVEQVCQSLAAIAPLRLAEPWDNVGLLVGRRAVAVERIMVCLTITPPVVDEALQQQAGLLVAHHPLPFKPTARLTDDTTVGRMLLGLIAGGVGVYSAHTAYDSAAEGINQQLADGLQLVDIAPLQPPPDADGPPAIQLGAGRCGRLRSPLPLTALAEAVGRLTGAQEVRLVGADGGLLTGKVALACGSGGSFLDAAVRRGCRAMVTGEATFHTCLEAEAQGLGLVLLGHYASERFAIEHLAARLGVLHPELTVWASRAESNPIRSLPIAVH